MNLSDSKVLVPSRVAILLFAAQFVTSADAASFFGLGMLSSHQGSGWFPGPAISADGSVVVGVSGGGDIQFASNGAFRWTMETGIEGLGFPEAVSS
jgi:hypothetical protein